MPGRLKCTLKQPHALDLVVMNRALDKSPRIIKLRLGSDVVLR